MPFVSKGIQLHAKLSSEQLIPLESQWQPVANNSTLESETMIVSTTTYRFQEEPGMDWEKRETEDAGQSFRIKQEVQLKKQLSLDQMDR